MNSWRLKRIQISSDTSFFKVSYLSSSTAMIIKLLTFTLAIVLQCRVVFAFQEPTVDTDPLSKLRSLGATVVEESDTTIDVGDGGPIVVEVRIDEKWQGESLELLTQVPNLKYLSLRHRGVFDSFLKIAHRLDRLEELEIIVGDRVPTQLSEIAALDWIDDLTISGEALKSDDVQFLCKLTQLKSLSLANSKVDDEIAGVLKVMLNLESLNLKGTGVTSDVLEFLPPKLRFLGLRDTGIGNDSVHYLYRLRLLRVLDLTNTAVSPKAIESLSFHSNSLRIVSETSKSP